MEPTQPPTSKMADILAEHPDEYKYRSGSNNARNNVSDGQKWLNSNYGDKILKYCGAELRVDGDYGDKSRWAALAVWKDLMNRRYGTKLDPTNKNFSNHAKKLLRKPPSAMELREPLPSWFSSPSQRKAFISATWTLSAETV